MFHSREDCPLNQNRRPSRLPVFLGIFLTSTSILMMELVLTRIFSVKLYYHYAFMVVSLALLGGGASGIHVYLFSGFFRREKLEKHLTLFAAAYALTVPVVLWLVVALKLQFSFAPIQMARVFLLYLLPAIPFFLGGICISLAMTHRPQDVGRLYAFDLAGAATGCLLVIPVLHYLGGPDAMLAAGVLAAGASLCFAHGVERGTAWRRLPFLALLLLGFLLALDLCRPFYKIRDVKGRDEWGVLFTKWNSFSRITVVQVDRDPKNTWIIMDGDAGTLLPDFDGDLLRWRHLQRSLSSLAYHLKKNARALVIGPGGGIDILTALTFGNRPVTGVEINPIIVEDVMRGAFREFTGGLYLRPDVRIEIDEGRSFIRRAPQPYDIIQATLVDTWAATAAGAFALTENNLYTVEAFKDYFARLKPDGILTITRWNLDPPQQDLRLVAITRAAMEETGLRHPERAIMVVRGQRRSEAVECNFLFKKSGFTDAEVDTIERLCGDNGFEILYTPRTRPNNPFTELITAEDPVAFYRSYPFVVTPTRDNSPFFFHTVRARQVWQSLFLPWESKKTNIGLLILYLVLGFAATMVLVFILVPLYWKGRRDETEKAVRATGLAYFLFLGLGYVLVEMTLVQKFILFLGRPVYALSVVLFSTLLFSGLGSRFSARLVAAKLPRRMRCLCSLIALGILVYVIVLPFFLYRLVAWPLPARAALVMLLLFPLTFLMGMPLPLGISWLRRTAAGVVPWAWGLNGSASVLGSILAVALAVHFGFDQTLAVAAASYLCAGVSVTGYPSVA